VTSDAFGVTVPLRADLNAPAGVLLDRVVKRAGFPKIWHYDGRIGVRFDYELMNGDQPLERGRLLSAQNVADRAILWLKTRMSPFSEAAALEGTMTSTTFRAETSGPFVEKYLSGAHEAYLRAVHAAQLGPMETLQPDLS
jgi:hypothetical protein